MTTITRRSVLQSGAAVAAGMALTSTAQAQPAEQLTEASPKGYDTVTLVPVIYTKKPEYWRIEVVACQPGILLPTIGFYNEHLPLDQYRGTKGIEVFWADDSVKIDV